ncbi:MAG: Ig-like domain-containing protein [Candidatus Anstonellales archaeon]
MSEHKGAAFLLLLLISALHGQSSQQCSLIDFTCTGCVRTSLSIIEVQNGYARAILVGQYTVTYAEIDPSCITNPIPECQQLITQSCYADGQPISFYYNDGTDSEFHPLGNCQDVLTSSGGIAECSFNLQPGVYIIKAVYDGDPHFLGSSSERTMRIGESSVVGAISQSILNSLSAIMASNPTVCVAAVFLTGILFASMFASGIDPLRYLDIASPRIRKKKRYTASRGARGYDQRKMRMNWGKISSEINAYMVNALAMFGLKLTEKELKDLMVGRKGVFETAVEKRWNKNRILEEMIKEIEKKLGRKLLQEEKDALDPLLSMYYAVMMADPARKLAQKEQEPSRSWVGQFTKRFRNLLEGVSGRIPLTANVYFDAIRSGSRLIREFKRMIKVRLASAPQLTLGVMGLLGARDFVKRVEHERAKIAEDSYKKEPHPIKDFVRALSKSKRGERLARAMAYLSYPGSKESVGANLSLMMRFMDVVSLQEARYHQWMREGYQSVYFYALARIFKERLGIESKDLSKIVSNLITKDKDGNLVVDMETLLGAKGLSSGTIGATFLLVRHYDQLLKLIKAIDPNKPDRDQINALVAKLRELNIYLDPAYFIAAYAHLKRHGLLDDIETTQRILRQVAEAFREAYLNANQKYKDEKIDSVDMLTLEEKLRAHLMLRIIRQNGVYVDKEVFTFFTELNRIRADNRPESIKALDLYNFISRSSYYRKDSIPFASTGYNDFYHFMMEKELTKSNYQFFFLKEYAAQLGHISMASEQEFKIYSNKAEFAAIATTTLKALNELFGLGSRHINNSIQYFIIDLMNSIRRVGSNPIENYALALQALFPQWNIDEMIKKGALQLTNIFSKPFEATGTSLDQIGGAVHEKVGAKAKSIVSGIGRIGMDKNISEVLKSNFRGIQYEAANNQLWAFDLRGHWKIGGDRLKVAAIETVSRAYDSPHKPGPDTPDARLAMTRELFLENMLSVFARGNITSFGANWRTDFEKADLKFFNALARYYAKEKGQTNLDDASVREYVAKNINDFHNFLLNTRINPLKMDQSVPWIMTRGNSFVPYENGMSVSIFDGITGARLMFKDEKGNFKVLDPSYKMFSTSQMEELAKKLAAADPSIFGNYKSAFFNAAKLMTIQKEEFKESIRLLLQSGKLSAYDVALLSFKLQHSGHHIGLLDVLGPDDYKIVTVKKMAQDQAEMGGWEGIKGKLKQIGFGLLDEVLARPLYISAPRAEQITDLLVGSSLLLYEGRKASAKMFEEMHRNADYLKEKKLAGIYSAILDRYMKFEGGWDYAITRDPRLHVPSMEGEERITHGYFQVGPALPYPSEMHWKTFQDDIEWRYSGPMLGRISKFAQFVAKPFIMASRLMSYIGGGYPSPKSLGYLVDEQGRVIEPDTMQPFPYTGMRYLGRFRTLIETLFTPSTWMTGPSMDIWNLSNRVAYWFAGEAKEPSSGSGEGGSRFKKWGYGGEEVIYGAPRPHQFVTPFYNPAVYNIWQAMANPGHSYFDSLGQYRLNPQMHLWALRLYGASSPQEMSREGQKVLLPMSRELMHEANAPIYRREIPTPELLIKNRYELSYYSVTEGYMNRIITGGALWNLSKEERKKESWKHSIGLGFAPMLFAALPAGASVAGIYAGIRSGKAFWESAKDEYRESLKDEVRHAFCPRCGIRLVQGRCLHGHSTFHSSA